MNLTFIIQRLSANIGVFEKLCEGVSNEQVRWKPSPEKWSILEVVNHLYDEEREDFRARTQLLLKKNNAPLPPIAPKKWVTERNYNAQDFSKSLQNFLAERQKSLDWLTHLKLPDWQGSYNHPRLGKMTAETLLANWLAHDFLHIRQLNRLHWEYFAAQVPHINLAYAGNW